MSAGKTVSLNNKEYVVSDELKELAKKVITEQSIDTGNAKIVYLIVYPNISKTVAGKCVKTRNELKFFSEHDYIIKMSGDLWDSLDDDVRYVLMQHELMHVMPVNDEKSGEYKFEIRKHDIEDFEKIINKHGTEWINKIKLTISSLYDLSPASEDKIVI